MRYDLDNIHDVMVYHPPQTEERKKAHASVNMSAEAWAREILEDIPECADRTKAINHIIEARMWANSAIAHEGKY